MVTAVTAGNTTQKMTKPLPSKDSNRVTAKEAKKRKEIIYISIEIG